jgi:hypothetical protein
MLRRASLIPLLAAAALATRPMPAHAWGAVTHVAICRAVIGEARRQGLIGVDFNEDLCLRGAVAPDVLFNMETLGAGWVDALMGALGDLAGGAQGAALGGGLGNAVDQALGNGAGDALNQALGGLARAGGDGVDEGRPIKTLGDEGIHDQQDAFIAALAQQVNGDADRMAFALGVATHLRSDRALEESRDDVGVDLNDTQLLRYAFEAYTQSQTAPMQQPSVPPLRDLLADGQPCSAMMGAAAGGLVPGLALDAPTLAHHAWVYDTSSELLFAPLGQPAVQAALVAPLVNPLSWWGWGLDAGAHPALDGMTGLEAYHHYYQRSVALALELWGGAPPATEPEPPLPPAPDRPVLSDGTVSPDRGDILTEFTYAARCRVPEGVTLEDVCVLIDGADAEHTKAMEPVATMADGSVRYEYQVVGLAPDQAHQYRFRAQDAEGAVYLPRPEAQPDYLDGPGVTLPQPEPGPEPTFELTLTSDLDQLCANGFSVAAVTAQVQVDGEPYNPDADPGRVLSLEVRADPGGGGTGGLIPAELGEDGRPKPMPLSVESSAAPLWDREVDSGSPVYYYRAPVDPATVKIAAKLTTRGAVLATDEVTIKCLSGDTRRTVRVGKVGDTEVALEVGKYDNVLPLFLETWVRDILPRFKAAGMRLPSEVTIKMRKPGEKSRADPPSGVLISAYAPDIAHELTHWVQNGAYAMSYSSIMFQPAKAWFAEGMARWVERAIAAGDRRPELGAASDFFPWVVIPYVTSDDDASQKYNGAASFLRHVSGFGSQTGGTPEQNLEAVAELLGLSETDEALASDAVSRGYSRVGLSRYAAACIAMANRHRNAGCHMTLLDWEALRLVWSEAEGIDLGHL